jgi:hypothetical protein
MLSRVEASIYGRAASGGGTAHTSPSSASTAAAIICAAIAWRGFALPLMAAF